MPTAPGPEAIDRQCLKALVFDLGGVLIDIDFQRCVAMWARAGGCSAEILSRRFQLDQTYCLHETGDIDFTGYAGHLRRQLDLQLDEEVLLQGWNALLGDTMPGAAQLLQLSASHYPCYIFSNTNASHHRHWASQQEDVLKPVTDIYLSYELGMRKPQAEAFHEIVQRIGCQPGEIAFFDDTEENITAARNQGIQAVWADAPEIITKILF